MPETDFVLFYILNKHIEPQGSVDLQNLQELKISYENKGCLNNSSLVARSVFLMCA